MTSVTPYVNGEALETKSQPGFGSTGSTPLFIGGRGANAPGYSWNGSIDEVAIYSSALSQTAIQTHYANLVYGTNTSGPSIVSLPASKTLLAGGSPVLKVVAGGTPPLSYQWTSNGVAIPEATSASLTLPNSTPSFSADYGVTVANSFGTIDGGPVSLTFVAGPGGYPGAVLNDHPIAYWRQDESSGTNLLDSVGFYDGTYSGSVTLGQPGVFASDTAVAYIGGKGVIPWSAALNPAGPFSIELWAKSLDNSDLRTMFSAQNRNAGRSGYALYHHVNTEAFEVHMGNASTVTMFLNGPKPVELNTWYHVVITYDGTGGTLYVDGQVAPDGTASGDFNPNTSMPLTFGQRTDGAWLNNGLIDEVAFYNYALTMEQVTSHWSFVWAPAAITQSPASTTAAEWSTIDLTGTASGIPNTYQWTKNGVALTEVNNPDGTARYPNGLTNATLTISEIHPADAGQYRLVVSNPLGNATSDPATLTVTADTQPPEVTFSAGLGTPDPYGTTTPFLAKVTFDELIDTVTGADASKFSLDGGVTISTATLSDDWRSVFLATSGLTPGQKYTLTINGLKDQAQSPNTLTSKSVTFTAPVLTQGALVWDYYYPVTPQGVENLLALPTYPFAPNTNLVLTVFDSDQITGGDLNNVAGFGLPGENYGASVSGWITPTVTTNYYFFIASDDASQLWLSTSDDPTLAQLIAEETSCCHGFQDPGNPTTSLPQPLVQGQRYFIRALMTEGGGGDFVKVAWKMEGDPTAAADLTPIAGSVLSAYAPVPAAQFMPPTYNPATGELTLIWSGDGALEQSSDLVSWTAVSGNPTSPFTVDITSATRMFYRVRQ